MPRKTKQKTQIESRRRDVARLYKRGYTQQQIADALQVNQSTVSRDIQTLLDRWQDEQQETVDRVITLEIAKLDLIEAELWERWQAARDPKIMRLIINAIERRASLLGLDAPKRTEHTGANNGPIRYELVFPEDTE